MVIMYIYYLIRLNDLIKIVNFKILIFAFSEKYKII